MIHTEPSPLAGQTVDVALRGMRPNEPTATTPALFTVEDWWDRVDGRSWTDCNGVLPVIQYAMRAGFTGTLDMVDDEVLYGRIAWDGHDGGKVLVHISEIRDSEIVEQDGLTDDHSESPR